MTLEGRAGPVPSTPAQHPDPLGQKRGPSPGTGTRIGVLGRGEQSILVLGRSQNPHTSQG